jgi:AcrR family transcriptional regulator
VPTVRTTQLNPPDAADAFKLPSTDVSEIAEIVRRTIEARRSRILFIVEAHWPFAEQSPENNRDEILRSAIELFARRGFDGCSVRELAAAVDLTSATLYAYFPSKEHIFRAAMWFIIGDFMLKVLKPLSEEDPSQWFECVVRRYAAYQIKNRDMVTACDSFAYLDRVTLDHMGYEEYLRFRGVQAEYFELVRELAASRPGQRRRHQSLLDATAIICLCDSVNFWLSNSGLSASEAVEETWRAVQRIVGTSA